MKREAEVVTLSDDDVKPDVKPKVGSSKLSATPVASTSKGSSTVKKEAASKSKTEKDFVPTCLAESWETAAVWAFIWRFAPVQKYCYMPSTFDEFEAAMLAPEDPSFENVDTVSIGYVLKWLARISGRVFFGGGKNYTHFLNYWVEDVAFSEVGQQRYDLYERWNGENLVRHQKSIYALEWEERIHLLRLICDCALSEYSEIRETINDAYHILPQRNARRTLESNDLVVEKIGVNPDAKSHHILHLDDSPRLFELYNPTKLKRPWQQLSSTREELDEAIDKLCGPKGADKKSAMAPMFAGKTGKLKIELRKEYEARVLPAIKRSTKRLDKINAAREKERAKHLKELEQQEEEVRLEAEQERLAALPPAPVASSRPRVRTRPKQKRVDYGLSDDDAADDAGEEYDQEDGDDDAFDEMPRVSSRSRTTRAQARGIQIDDFEEYEIGSDDEPRAKRARVGPRSTRSSRRAAIVEVDEDEEDDPVAEVMAYEARQQAEKWPSIPFGEKAASYDLASVDDYEIYSGARARVKKGSQTARREVLAQMTDVEQAYKHVLHTERRVPEGHSASDYNVMADDDSTVYSRGREKQVRGWNSAARVIAEALAEEAAQLLAAEEPARKLVKKTSTSDDDEATEHQNTSTEDRRRSSSNTSVEAAVVESKAESDYDPDAATGESQPMEVDEE